MKTIKKLKSEIDEKRRIALKVHKGKITRSFQEQRDNDISYLEGEDKALKNVLGLINVKQPKILNADWLNLHRNELGSINIDLVMEFIKIVSDHERWARAEELKARITG